MDECKECGEPIDDIDPIEDGDERTYKCPSCGFENMSYWDDNPFFRGWS